MSCGARRPYGIDHVEFTQWVRCKRVCGPGHRATVLHTRRWNQKEHSTAIAPVNGGEEVSFVHARRARGPGKSKEAREAERVMCGLIDPHHRARDVWLD